MSGDDTVHVLWSIGALVLVGSALAARRVPMGTLVRGFLGWAAIGGVLFVLFANQDKLVLLGERLGISDQQVAGETVRIRQGLDGHFYADARINGVRARMLVDSGATFTALSTATATQAGIQTDGGLPVVLSTANGAVQAQRGRIENFAIGGLETRDLSVVVSPSFGDVNVVGMNFLSRLGSWRVEGQTLILEPKRD